MVDFNKLKKRNSMESLTKQVEKVANSGFKSEREGYWTATTDKDGNGSAIIRFVPGPEWFETEDNENTFFVNYFEHSFQGPTGKWYIEKSLTTFGQDDPVSKYNSMLWNSGIDAKKEIARKQKRKQVYVSNILVIKDPANPENNGKVFKFKYGPKIYTKIKDALAGKPEFDEPPLNAFDLFEGANFKLSIRKVDKFPNYDNSSFADPSELTEEQIQVIADGVKSLKDLVDPTKYKTYAELEKKLNAVLDINGARKETETQDESDAPWAESASEKTEESIWDTAEDTDSDLDYFTKIANS